MAFTPLSDLGRHFANRQANLQIREKLETLTAEVASGEASDMSAHLGVQTGQFAAIKHRLSMIESYTKSASLLATQLTAMQSALENIDTQRGNISAQLISVSSQATQVELSAATEAARNGFAQVVASLNTQSAGVSLFAGASTDGPAVSDGDDILAALEGYVAGAVTVADAKQRIADWFDASFPAAGAGGVGYHGAPGENMTRQIDADLTVTISVRADDPVLVGLMRDLATAAISDKLGFSNTAQAQLVHAAGEGLITQASGLSAARARLGLAEQTVAQTQAKLAVEKTSLATTRNDMAQIDTFEASTALQAVSDQLELHYTLTARLASLSLTNYLR
ncbi:flagellin and related hook-associated protein [Ketogulonicigenium robustum]|uniref:Flagellin and related hook-associated protein n=1 Tax=Ketogulonicigenium robustum TaxID=92947 RepID=A0A1W6P1N9_9RHOB|nr:flagellin [Ketogulonicigenium robustum]ARO15428.1 flagellin and related hook-associated protein [Ketogulonicigenium robustum]